MEEGDLCYQQYKSRRKTGENSLFFNSKLGRFAAKRVEVVGILINYQYEELKTVGKTFLSKAAFCEIYAHIKKVWTKPSLIFMIDARQEHLKVEYTGRTYNTSFSSLFMNGSNKLECYITLGRKGCEEQTLKHFGPIHKLLMWALSKLQMINKFVNYSYDKHTSLSHKNENERLKTLGTF